MRTPSDRHLRPVPPRTPHPDGPDGGEGPDPDHAHQVALITEAVIGGITAGQLDAHLPDLADAIEQRLRQLTLQRSLEALARFRPGDRVRFNDTARPLYLHGLVATVVDRTARNLVVDLDQPVGRFDTGRLRCPPLTVDPLEEP